MTKNSDDRTREDAAVGRKEMLDHAREVVRVEAQTIAKLEELIGDTFLQAAERILSCEGMVLVTGLGKAGLVGAKISATFASTGTPSISLHPTEALHGDLGRLRAFDVVLVLSNSGETEEVKNLLPHIKRIGAKIVAITGAPESSLGRLSDFVLDIGNVDEACPHGLAPTASTSAMLALGDALAMVVQRARGFSRDDYARYHPGGMLGRKLLQIGEVMRTEDELPLVGPDETVVEVLRTMSNTRGRPGAALIVGPKGELVGIFTDGDFRRLLESGDRTRLDSPVREFMGKNPKHLGPEALVDEAERIMRTHKIDQLAIVDDEGKAIGLLDVQDLLPTRL